MSLHDFFWFSAVAAVIAVAAHSLIRHFGLALLVGCIIPSLANIVCEVASHSVAVRPVDALVWFPFMLFEGMLVALPAVVIVGVPFCVVRNWGGFRRSMGRPPPP